MGDDLIFVCNESNDLFRAAGGGRGSRLRRVESALEAVDKAAHGGAVLALADGYPDKRTPLPPPFWEAAATKNLRILAEFPDLVPGCSLGETVEAPWERGVVTSTLFPGLDPMRLLAIHDCRLIEAHAEAAHLVLARVAGFDSAIFGLPEATHPVLFESPVGPVLVATTKLSQFVTARYAPADAWRAVWEGVFAWLCPGGQPVPLTWTPTVRPTYPAHGPLPDDAEARAFQRGAAWFTNANLFPRESWPDDRSSWPDRVGPPPEPGWPPGDGSAGMLEGFSSCIGHDGRQPMRWWTRSDCMGEAMMALAFDGAINENTRHAHISANLGDFLFLNSGALGGPRDDPRSPSHGLMSWDLGPGRGIYYGDDNARALLGALAASALLSIDRWDEKILRCAMANMRTTGPLGFRGWRLDEEQLRESGWQYFYHEERVHFAPHYEAFLWACFLWAHAQSREPLFLDRTRTAISMTMDAYPDQWQWTNGLQQERARMLLCLAWLVRADDSPTHRAWLRRVASDLLAHQDSCGAIREQLGPRGKGAFGAPESNEQYGNSEAPLIQENGDPLADLLYTTNFAFVGLHEAACATGDPLYREAEDRLAQFLCRAQVRSEHHPELDGGWFRAFDFRRWEYWASNADHGWGAWSIESGWTCAWITSVFAMRRARTSLWDLTSASRAHLHHDTLAKELFGVMPRENPNHERPLNHETPH